MGKMTKSKELIIAVFIFVSVIITTVILAVCAVSERENEKNMQKIKFKVLLSRRVLNIYRKQERKMLKL